MYGHRQLRKLLIIPLLILIFAIPVQAHSGRTDSKGGHHVTATGEYHYHHGYPAHQHPNGICPYAANSVSANTSESDSNNPFWFIIPLAGVGSVVYIMKTKTEKKRLEKESKLQFEEEKQYFSSQYMGKSIKELAKVPNNIDFDENDLPISIDDSGLKWGKEFTVYVSKNRQCYHRRAGCSGVLKPEHIFNEAARLSARGCSKCAFSETYVIPEWYRKYIEIKKIKERYGI